MLDKLIKKHPDLHSLITGIALIIFWRGIWMLMDIYIFPNNETLSAITSIAIGLFILYINDRKLKELC